MVSDIKAEILRFKKEIGVTILAHSYQKAEILEVADFVGDSFQLSTMAQKDTKGTCVVCGVHFMAETVKILSPAKKVILANELAGCPMAEQFTLDEIADFKSLHPEYTVVAYINTTAALKTVSDVCVTSATAVKICENIQNNNILFLPDCNLGAYVAAKLPYKNIYLMKGGCPIHASVNALDVTAAKLLHPNALVLSHPECTSEVLAESDFIGSTSAIMEYAKNSANSDFIIGTEISIAEHLSNSLVNKNFYVLSKKLVCPDMRITTLVDVLNAVKGTGGITIDLPNGIIEKASICINEMLRLGE